METAADKLSALAWRVRVRDRASADDDPSIVRHIHDLAGLAEKAGGSSAFVPLARQLVERDAKRTKLVGIDGLSLLGSLIPTISDDRLWQTDYDQFVRAAAFGADNERIGFDEAVAACRRLVNQVMAGWSPPPDR